MRKAAAILISSLNNFDKLIVINVKQNALVLFLDSLIEWKAKIVAVFRTNQAMKRHSTRQKKIKVMPLNATFAVSSL